MKRIILTLALLLLPSLAFASDSFFGSDPLQDGYKVTISNWDSLDFEQKQKFIDEALPEIERNVKGKIVLRLSKDDFFIVTDLSTQYTAEKFPDSQTPLIVSIANNLERTGEIKR